MMKSTTILLLMVLPLGSAFQIEAAERQIRILKDGHEVPRSHPALTFTATGDLEILAAGNRDATSHLTMWRSKAMPAYNGKCLVIVRGKGELAVSAEGLEGAALKIE